MIFNGGQIHGTGHGQFGNGILLDGAGTIQFNGTTCEWLDQCIAVRGGSNISFRNGWIENVKQVANALDTRVRGLYIDRNYIANSCYNLQDHSGFCFLMPPGDGSFGSFSQNILNWSSAKPDHVVPSPSRSIAVERNYYRSSLQDLPAQHPSANCPSAALSSLRAGHLVLPSIASGRRQEVTIKWAPSPFSDANYDASCTIRNPSSRLSVVGIQDATASLIKVAIENNDKTRSESGSLSCIGIHN
jgi:hypothetical protein